MKKEDFFGKWILRQGDLLPEEIDSFLWKHYCFTIDFCKYLMEKGLIFDDKESAMEHYRCIMGSMKKSIDRNVSKEEKKPHVYISGPISGHEDTCEKAFGIVEKMLTDAGFRTFNPLNNGLPSSASTNRHMRRDLNILTNEDDPFDYIFMMKRWAHSAGCTKELETAISCGIKVIFEESSIKDGVHTVVRGIYYVAISFE